MVKSSSVESLLSKVYNRYDTTALQKLAYYNLYNIPKGNRVINYRYKLLFNLHIIYTTIPFHNRYIKIDILYYKNLHIVRYTAFL